MLIKDKNTPSLIRVVLTSSVAGLVNNVVACWCVHAWKYRRIGTVHGGRLVQAVKIDRFLSPHQATNPIPDVSGTGGVGARIREA
jgi:hypothetical protein